MEPEKNGAGGWGGGEGRIHISNLLQDIRVFLQERDGEGREEGGAGEGGRREGMVEGRGRDKDSFCSHTCDPTSQETIVFLMTANSPVTVEVSKVIWKTWNLTRMDLGGGRHLTCLRTLCSKLVEQYNRACHNTSKVE